MWFDPIQKKTLIYGGLGRPTPSDRLERYNDMWSLGTNGWTQNTTAKVPTNPRYGAQIAVDPRTGHALLLGGLRLDSVLKDQTTIFSQVYANDTWDWDGTNWTEIQTNNVPPGRENGAMEFDYGRNDFVLFGGWTGYFLSDTWLLDGNTWTLIPESTGRRRSASGRH